MHDGKLGAYALGNIYIGELRAVSERDITASSQGGGVWALSV